MNVKLDNMGFSRKGTGDPPVKKKKVTSGVINSLEKSGVISKKVAVNDTRRKVFKRLPKKTNVAAAATKNVFPKGSTAHRRLESEKRKRRPAN